MVAGVISTPRPALRGLPLYALIDPYLGEYPDHAQGASECATFESLRGLRVRAWRDMEVYLAENDDPVADVHRLPYIVDLRDADDSFIDELIAAAAAEHRSALEGEVPRYRIGAFIETWMAPQDLMLRLQKMWRYPPHLHDFHYLRIADRRVFEALTHLFEPAAIARWLGPIACWHILGRDLGWRCIEGDAERWYTDSGLGWRRTVDAGRALDDASLIVSAQQHWRLYDLEAVSRALLDWQAAGRAIDGDIFEKAWRGAREAERLGLRDAEDKAAFAFQWIRDPDCASHPPVSLALQRSRDEGRPFSEILLDLKFEIDQSEPPPGRPGLQNSSASLS